MGLLQPHSAYVRTIRMTIVGLYYISCVGRETALNDLRSENNVPTTKQSVHEDISESSIHGKTRPYMSAIETGFRTPRERVMS